MNCVCRNLGEPQRFNEAVEEVEETTRQYVAAVVGPTRSRGVNRVTPVECIGHTRRGWRSIAKRVCENNAKHRNG